MRLHTTIGLVTLVFLSIGRDFEEYGFDDSTPSPNYNPGTPGGGSGTPGGQGSGYSQESPANPYTPQTPGSVYNPQDGYSPYQPSPSPTGGYQCKFNMS